MKFSLSLAGLEAKTPKVISHIGTALASAAATAGTLSFVTDHKIWGGILIGTAFVGKFLAECFMVDDTKTNNNG